MQTIIRSFTPEKGKRLLVTSDVHGHDKLLGSLLARARFSKDDTLIIVGDLLDKGPESLKTLRRVMALSRDHRVFALMGNVDCWRLNHFFSRTEAERRQAMESALWVEKYWGSSLLSECCREIGVTPSPDAPAGTFERLRARFAPELAFLQGMPTMLVTPEMIFVHGGLPHENLSALEAQDGFSLLKCDHFYENGQSFEKTIVVGHWPVTLYRSAFPDHSPLYDPLRRILCIDGGCGVKQDGQINLIILPNGDLSAMETLSADDLPVITALDAQAPSTGSHYIKWTNRYVTPLARADGWATVAHQGAELRVPECMLQQEDGEWTCRDYTDYLLPVAPDEKLKLIEAFPQGCYVKKGSVCGLYLGKYIQN